ncbi:hypothetical protein LTR62_007747 [Meristemomyces frigidus]|uniref:Uncharacterized protein n=1 Tax=Meristemomyces frigidus TaxID=1508187 RepID=A0AAN7TBG1_9PEZI|nr:hypothetical protein LTR62_007747 [Meristemomyces frigidus]
MKKSISARRVPRRVGGDEEDATSGGVDSSTPSLQRPIVKPRKSGVSRKAFSAAIDEDEEPSGVITPKRGNLSRIASQRNAAIRASILSPREVEEEDGSKASYDAASLHELKASTPSTPRDLTTAADDTAIQGVANSTRDLDLSSKFGSSLSRYQAERNSSAIPSAAEILEKKARRARLAQEEKADEYISLDPDDPDLDNDDEDDNVMKDMDGRLVLKPKDKWKESESRLVKDDEDIMENFDDFTEDGKIHLGRNAEREGEKKRRREMADRIAAAEGEDDSEIDSDAGEKERHAVFEAAQTRHGTYGSTNTTPSDLYAHLRPTAPAVMPPLPTLDGALTRLKKQLAEMQTTRAQKLQEMQMLRKEKVRLEEEEVRIQKSLRETAEKFEGIRREKGILVGGEAAAGLLMEDGEGDGLLEETGDDDGKVSGQEAEEKKAGVSVPAHVLQEFAARMAGGVPRSGPPMNLGMGMGAGLGMGRPPAAEDDW